MTAVVCAIITNYKGQIFAARRAKGKSFEGYWEFPGGKIEEGELPEEALGRELQEELSVGIKKFTFLEAVEWSNKTGSFKLSAFVCKSDLEGIRLVDHDQWAWFEFADLIDLEMMVADLAFLPHLERYLNA